MTGNYFEIGGLRTHYVEAGHGEPLVLLHSGEFGASADFSWEFNIGPLSEHFRVIAPDWLGFGRSSKVFSFDDMQALRIRHIASLLKDLDISSAHFIGNSMGGGQLARAAAMQPSPFPIDKMILAAAGGVAPANDARQTLNSYDATVEHMQRIVDVLIQRPKVRDDVEYVRRRHEASLQPGAWEAAAAARFKMPGRESSERQPIAYDNIKVPTLIIAGALDPLRLPGYAAELQGQIEGSELVVFPDAGHSPQIDNPDEFNDIVIEFLNR